MRSLLFVGAFLFSVTPSFAETLVLRCNITIKDY